MTTRINKDEADVQAIVDLLEHDWTNPFGKDPSDLISISTGAAATPEASNDLLNALERGKAAYKIFQEQRLQEGTGSMTKLTRSICESLVKPQRKPSGAQRNCLKGRQKTVWYHDSYCKK